MSDAGALAPEAIAELGGRYGLPFARPDWLGDVIERYNLTPPPGR